MREPIHVRLKSNGDYWQACWKLPGQPIGVKSLGAKAKYSKRQANALCRHLGAELARDPALRNPSSMVRLSEWIERYKSMRNDVSKATGAIIDCTGRYLLNYFDHDPVINRITRAEASEWRHALATGECNLDNSIHCKQPSDQTVCKYVRAAKKMFAEAEDQERIAANPFIKLKSTPAKAVKNWAYLDAVAMQRIFDACPSIGWTMLFALCRFAGLRREEALTLRWGAIKWEGNRFTANADIGQESNKKRVRVVPIEPAHCPSGLTAMLREAYDNAPEGSVGPCDGVPDPRRYDVHGKAKRIIIAAGVALYAKPFHTLRKNCETDWAQEYPQHVVSEWIGHDISVSAEHYLRVPEELYVRGTNCAESGLKTPQNAHKGHATN
jgi:integrase